MTCANLKKEWIQIKSFFSDSLDFTDFQIKRQVTSTICHNVNPPNCDHRKQSVNVHVPFKSHRTPGALTHTAMLQVAHCQPHNRPLMK